MTREYFLEDPLHPRGGINIKCKYETDCVFCEHCTDVFWDYTKITHECIAENLSDYCPNCGAYMKGDTE